MKKTIKWLTRFLPMTLIVLGVLNLFCIPAMAIAFKDINPLNWNEFARMLFAILNSLLTLICALISTDEDLVK